MAAVLPYLHTIQRNTLGTVWAAWLAAVAHPCICALKCNQACPCLRMDAMAVSPAGSADCCWGLARDRDRDRDRDREREREREKERERERVRDRHREYARERSERRPAAAAVERPRSRENGIINAVPSPPHRGSTKSAPQGSHWRC